MGKYIRAKSLYKTKVWNHRKVLLNLITTYLNILDRIETGTKFRTGEFSQDFLLFRCAASFVTQHNFSVEMSESKQASLYRVCFLSILENWSRPNLSGELIYRPFPLWKRSGQKSARGPAFFPRSKHLGFFLLSASGRAYVRSVEW